MTEDQKKIIERFSISGKFWNWYELRLAVSAMREELHDQEMLVNKYKSMLKANVLT